MHPALKSPKIFIINFFDLYAMYYTATKEQVADRVFYSYK